MQYLLMIYAAESAVPQPGTAEHDKMMQGYNDLAQELEAKGLKKGGNALDSILTATTVRVRNGKAQTTDGPFAETKEQLGGFFLLDCKDLDQAIECAARIPGAAFGSIEIRPVVSCAGEGG